MQTNMSWEKVGQWLSPIGGREKQERKIIDWREETSRGDELIIFSPMSTFIQLYALNMCTFYCMSISP